MPSTPSTTSKSNIVQQAYLQPHPENRSLRNAI